MLKRWEGPRLLDRIPHKSCRQWEMDCHLKGTVRKLGRCQQFFQHPGRHLYTRAFGLSSRGLPLESLQLQQIIAEKGAGDVIEEGKESNTSVYLSGQDCSPPCAQCFVSRQLLLLNAIIQS